MKKCRNKPSRKFSVLQQSPFRPTLGCPESLKIPNCSMNNHINISIILIHYCRLVWNINFCWHVGMSKTKWIHSIKVSRKRIHLVPFQQSPHRPKEFIARSRELVRSCVHAHVNTLAPMWQEGLAALFLEQTKLVLWINIIPTLSIQAHVIHWRW